VLFLWAAAPCGLVGRYKRFGETYCLCLQPWRYNPEDKHQHLFRHELLKTYQDGINASALNVTFTLQLLKARWFPRF
jgi:hypothetical protein